MSKTKLWTGRVISALPALFLLSSGVNLMFIKSPAVQESFAKFGYPENLVQVIGMIEFLCAVVYLIPRTSIFGAILLTGYLGGAVATHLRVNDPTLIVPIVVGMLLWLGLFLREDRLRALVPLKS